MEPSLTRRLGRRRLRGAPISVDSAPVADPEEMALWCSILACDRSRGEEATLSLPLPGTPECGPLWLATWAVFRQATTQIGYKLLLEDGVRVRQQFDPLAAFVRGKAVPAHLRWAEAEALIREGESDD